MFEKERQKIEIEEPSSLKIGKPTFTKAKFFNSKD